eukprot:scaffold314550_cov36-Tisochrysis_lutea.AAC.2
MDRSRKNTTLTQGRKRRLSVPGELSAPIFLVIGQPGTLKLLEHMTSCEKKQSHGDAIQPQRPAVAPFTARMQGRRQALLSRHVVL